MTRRGYCAVPLRPMIAQVIFLIGMFALGQLSAVDSAAVDSAAVDSAAWSQGRPFEALPALVASAETTQTWHAWYDAGLCAAAANDRGAAISYLWRARRLAPLQSGPVLALTILNANAPPLWTDRLGPLAVLGQGWLGLGLALIAGCALGSGWLSQRWRGWFLTGGFILTALVAPGVIAGMCDRHDPHRVAVIDTQLLDSTGTPIAALPAGTMVELSGQQWAGRWPVRLGDGRSGLINAGDVR